MSSVHEQRQAPRSSQLPAAEPTPEDLRAVLCALLLHAVAALDGEPETTPDSGGRTNETSGSQLPPETYLR